MFIQENFCEITSFRFYKWLFCDSRKKNNNNSTDTMNVHKYHGRMCWLIRSKDKWKNQHKLNTPNKHDICLDGIIL